MVDFFFKIMLYSRSGIIHKTTMITKTLGNCVQKRRKELGMKQSELALVSGTGVRFISDLENGKETCELGKTLKVLDHIGLELTLNPKAGD